MTKHFVEPEELQAYLDRELEPARRAEVESHVGKCAECSKLLSELKHVSATLQRWQVEPAPPTLRPPIVVEAKPQARWSWTRLALGLSGAVAVVLILVAISVPNLLRSRMATGPSARLTVSPGEEPGSGTASGTGRHWNAPPEAEGPISPNQLPSGQAVPGRLIAYQVTMTVEVKEFDEAKARLLKIVNEVGGYVAGASTANVPGGPQRGSLTLRVPAAQLSQVLERIRALGRVTRENLSTEEVTDQAVDLEARLRNSRATEQRLIEVLKNRTGKVGDILEVEREISRTRQEIERMEAQRRNLLQRVELATIQITLGEEFKAELMPAPVGTLTRLRNAMVDGYDNFLGSFLGLVIFVARYGLTLALWGGLGWLTWRGVRRSVLKAGRSL
jgi:hypothetical protein